MEIFQRTWKTYEHHNVLPNSFFHITYNKAGITYNHLDFPKRKPYFGQFENIILNP